MTRVIKKTVFENEVLRADRRYNFTASTTISKFTKVYPLPGSQI